MNHAEFTLAFWHPFGPHGREMPKEIIERKRKEIDVNGWTLWSFQHRPMLIDWKRELVSAQPDAVFAFCSEGRGAIDPAREGTLSTTINCQSYRFITDGETQWRSVPRGVRVPHPFRPGKKLASAFIVKRIIYPVEPFQLPPVEWFSPGKGPWCQAAVPTRPEYLIRQGGTIAMKGVSAILELKPPYLAVVSTDPAAGQLDGFDPDKCVAMYKSGSRVVDIAVAMGYERGYGQNRVRNVLLKAGIYKQ
jgi:hypothetical protein